MPSYFDRNQMGPKEINPRDGGPGSPNLNAPQMPPPPAMNSTGMVPGQYGGMVRNDEDGRGFTNADGGHDWNVGQGPGGDYGGQVNKTGQAPIGTEVLSGDSLGIPRGTPEYRAASAARQAWIQANLSQGRTLADLGLSPTRGGGLANFMSLGTTLRPGVAGGSAPTQPGSPGMPPGTPVPSTPIIGGGGINPPQIPTVAQPRGKTTATPGLGEIPVTNSLSSSGLSSVGSAANASDTLSNNRRSSVNNGNSAGGFGLTQPLNSSGLNQPLTSKPMRTGRVM